MNTLLFPHQFILNLTPNCGVFFDYKGFQQELVSVLGHSFDGDALKTALEKQWASFANGRCSEIWYRTASMDAWEKHETSKLSFSWILKDVSSCGLLFKTPFEQLSTPVFVFIEIRRNPKLYYRATYPYVATFSIRDEHANLLAPIESIVEDADTITRSERFRILVHKLRYYDNTPIIEDAALLLSTLGKIAWKFDERDLARNLQRCFAEDSSRDGSIGDNPILWDTGLYTKKEIDSLSIPNYRIAADASISLLFLKESKIYVLFGGDTEHGVPLADFYPAIDRFLNRKSPGFNLEELSRLSERRDWDFSNDSGKRVQLGSLNYYLELTFGRIDEDIQNNPDCQEIVLSPDGRGNLFCTGLRHREFGSYIYAFCSNPDEDGLFQTVKWVYRKRDSAGMTETPIELDFIDHKNRRNHGLPYPANWTREPEKLVFQYQNGSKADIFFNYEHMFDDHLDRIAIDGSDESGIGDELSFAEFKKRIEDAWPVTRKLLDANYKNAIPTYYDGDIHLLVPLFLDKRKPTTPSAALVLARDRTGKHYYYAPTFLTLAMARNNALVITRVDDSWLTPDPLPGTIAWLKGQLVDEPDKGKKEKIRTAIKSLSDLSLL